MISDVIKFDLCDEDLIKMNLHSTVTHDKVEILTNAHSMGIIGWVGICIKILVSNFSPKEGYPPRYFHMCIWKSG